MAPIENTLQPICTGGSVIAIKYKDGIVMGTDAMVSMGRTLKYPGSLRQTVVGGNTLVGFSGEYSDFQEISTILEGAELEDFLAQDGYSKGPKQIASLLASQMYRARTKLNPLYNVVVVGGVLNDGSPYLHYVDHQGTSYSEDYLATGLGMHFALPILREAYKPDLSLEEAKEVVEKCLKLLFYRDCKASCQVHISVAEKGKVPEIGELKTMQTFWKHPTWMKTQAELVGADKAGW